MTRRDRVEVLALVEEARALSSDRDWWARYAAERYYGLVTCGPYMDRVRALVAEEVAA